MVAAMSGSVGIQPSVEKKGRRRTLEKTLVSRKPPQLGSILGGLLE